MDYLDWRFWGLPATTAPTAAATAAATATPKKDFIFSVYFSEELINYRQQQHRQQQQLQMIMSLKLTY